MAYRPHLISFNRTDEVRTDLEDVIKEFADHFTKKRAYFKQFAQIVHTSRTWKIPSLQTSLDSWVRKFQGKEDRSELVELVRKVFTLCIDQDDLDYVRGLIVESLLIACHGGSTILNKKEYGWGAKVNIHTPTQTKTVRYTCFGSDDNDCKDKSTVDFAHWDGYNGIFYECKVSPKHIVCKDIKYVTHLREQLSSNGVSHETYFVCVEDKEEINNKLIEAGLPPTYKALGTRELENMIA
jgi:hypothetical protein